MADTPQKIVTRFAPSPTGFLHVGGVRTALYAWLFAEQNNGTLILRIEDTDKEREVEGSIQHIIDSLKWLGISWNEGPDIGGPNAPYLQSQRLASYKKYAEILVAKGLAYADPYTSEQLDEFRKKSELEKRPFIYREYRPENPPIWDGTQPLRLKTEAKSYKWKDDVRGDLSAGPEAVDDFILIKSDGYPTYNFAHIIDDLEMSVTHIFRADEFISSTPKFLALYEALGIAHPHFVTLPPIMGPDGKKKLGKRDGAKDILDYRTEGILPHAMMNFLALIGWNPGTEQELFSPQELIAAFDVSKIHVSGGGFNEEKLKWFNKEYLKKLSPQEIAKQVADILQKHNKPALSESAIGLFSTVALERVSTFGEFGDMVAAGEFEYVFAQPSYPKDSLLFKGAGDLAVTKTHLGKVLESIGALSDADFTADTVKAAIWDYASEVGRGNVLWPMRFALSGKDKSPDPFALAALLGKKVTLERLEAARTLIV